MKIGSRHCGNDASPGSSRRFAMLLGQLDRTHRIVGTSPDAIVGPLYPEFDKLRTVSQ